MTRFTIRAERADGTEEHCTNDHVTAAALASSLKARGFKVTVKDAEAPKPARKAPARG